MYLQKKYIKKKKVVRRRILSICMVCCMLLGLCGVNLISANAAEEAKKAKAIVLDSTDNTISAQTNEQENEQLTDNAGVDSSQVIDNTNQAAADQNGYTTNADQSADQSQDQTNSAQPGNDRIAVQSIVNNVYSDQMLGKFLAALGLSGNDFTVDNIQAAGVKDRNFAQAIYNSVINDQDDFYENITLSMGDNIKDQGTHVVESEVIEAGKNEGIIPRDTAVDSVSGIKLILSYFSGRIVANEAGITDIEGIKILRRALNIQLMYNQITDISCLEQGCGEITSGTDAKLYFGEENRNVYIYFEGNPLTRIYNVANGRIILDLGDGTETRFPDTTIRYAITGKETSGISTALLPAALFVVAKNKNLGLNGLLDPDENLYVDKSRSTIDVPDEDLKRIISGEEGFEGFQLLELKNSGKIHVAMSYDTVMNYYTKRNSSGANLNRLSVNAYKLVNVEMYSNIQIEYESNGCIHLHKEDDSGNALAGVSFDLYRCDAQGDVLIPKDTSETEYKTDKNGDVFVYGLSDGDYYFVEKSAPEGYLQEKYGQEQIVSDVGENGSNVTFAISENDRGERYSLYKAEGKAQGENDTCLQSGLAVDAYGNVSVNVAENGVYYLVQNKLFHIQTVKKSDIKLENKSKQISDGALGTRNLSAWDGDSIQTTDGSEAVNTESIQATENSGGFYVKGAVPEKKDGKGQTIEGTGEATGDQLAFSYLDNSSSPFYELTVSWTKSFNKDGENVGSGEKTYRIKQNDESDTKSVTYCKDAEELESKVQTQLQKLTASEYRNVKVKMKFGGGYENTDNWNVKKDNIQTVTVKNPRSTTLKVYKQNDAGKLLEGAEFTLYRAATDADTDAVEVTVGGVKKKVVAVDKQTTAKESADADKAVATFKGLANSSTYYLAETYLPTGHQYIKKDGADYEYATGKVYEVTTDSKGDVFIDGDKAEGKSGEHVFSITFTNVGITLPKSGFDGGYTLYTILAMLTITVAGAWLYMNKRKQKINF